MSLAAKTDKIYLILQKIKMFRTQPPSPPLHNHITSADFLSSSPSLILFHGNPWQPCLCHSRLLVWITLSHFWIPVLSYKTCVFQRLTSPFAMWHILSGCWAQQVQEQKWKLSDNIHLYWNSASNFSSSLWNHLITWEFQPCLFCTEFFSCFSFLSV